MGMAAITFTNFLFFSFFFLSPSVYTTDIRYCGKEADYEVKIYRVDISPNPVTRGRPATFSLSAFTEKAILGGKLNIDVSYFGWHVYSDTHDLCTKISCPVPAGDFVISHSQLLPVFTPPGSYSLKLKIVDANKLQLSCITFGVTITFGSFVAPF
ncbi:unnamed protein product [Amaranthus hypochondriacus]